MRKEVKYIIIIYLVFVVLLTLRIPIRILLDSHTYFNLLESELFAAIIIKLLLLTLLFIVIRRLELYSFNGIKHNLPIENLQVLLFPMTLVALGMMSNWNVYLDAEHRLLIIFIVSVLLLGLFEEFLFRGIILPLFIKAFGKHRHAIYLGVLLSALLFGVTHYLNLIKEPDNFWGVTSQVVFATAMGIFFAGLLFRTRNIFVPAIFHAMVNFSFGPSILKKESGLLPPDEVHTLLSWLPTIFFLFFIAFGGVYMIKRTKKEEIMSFLSEVKI